MAYLLFVLVNIDEREIGNRNRAFRGVAVRVADEPAPPKWNDAPDHPLDEAVAIRDVLKLMRDKRDVLKLNAAQTYLIDNTLRTLDDVVGRGRITPAERASMLQAARIIIMTAF